MNRKLLWIVLLVGMLLIPTAAALAKELGAMEISGPGVDGSLRIDDPKDMESIERSGFFDMSMRTSSPNEEKIAQLGEGYQITFFIRGGEEGEFVYRETATYYADPAGGRGFMHWTGGGETNVDIVPSSQWTRVKGGEDAFWDLLAQNGVTRPEISVAAVAPEVAQAPDDTANIAAQPEAAEAIVESAADAAEVPAAPSEPATQPAPPAWVWVVALSALVLIVAAAGIIFRQRGKHEESLVASD